MSANSLTYVKKLIQANTPTPTPTPSKSLSLTEAFGEGASVVRVGKGMPFNIIVPNSIKNEGEETGPRWKDNSREWVYNPQTNSFYENNNKAPPVKATDIGLNGSNAASVIFALPALADKTGQLQDSWAKYAIDNIKDPIQAATAMQADLPKIREYDNKPSGWDNLGSLVFDAALMAMGVPPVISGAMHGAVGASESNTSILKGAITGGVSGAVSSFVPNLPSSSNPVLDKISNSITKGAVKGGTNAALGGGSIVEGAVSGGISGAVGGTLSSISDVNPALSSLAKIGLRLNTLKSGASMPPKTSGSSGTSGTAPQRSVDVHSLIRSLIRSLIPAAPSKGK